MGENGPDQPNALGTRALCARDSDVLGRLDFSDGFIHGSVVETGERPVRQRVGRPEQP